ncbi:MAG: asparagine synthase-related protein [Candidatus Geothermarchaeota archaeon]
MEFIVARSDVDIVNKAKERLLSETRGNMLTTIEVDKYWILSTYPLLMHDNGVLIGEKFYEHEGLTSINEAKLKAEEAKALDLLYDGAYFNINFEDSIVHIDPIGLLPVYVGEYGFASNIRLLKAIGCKRIHQLPPNRLFKVIWNKGIILQYISQLIYFNRIKIESSSLENAAQLFIDTVARKLNTIKRKTRNNSKNVYISFSGGIDSTILACLAIEENLNPYLITVGCKHSTDILTSRKVAEWLGLTENHITVIFEDSVPNEESLVEEVKKVASIIENPNLHQLSLALPLYFAIKLYAKDSVLLLGQGTDELFGGYFKFLNIYKLYGYEAVEREIKLEISLSYRFNFAREMKLAAWGNVSLYYPFISPYIIVLAYSVPSEAKIRGVNDVYRKWLIRKVAEILKLPEDIVYKTKKSLQYSSKSLSLLQKVLGKRLSKLSLNDANIIT